MILIPNPKCGLECYVDADFCGAYKQCVELETDYMIMRSRTGYAINFADVPIMWISKRQSEIALSTTEAEFIALSQSLRDVIPIQSFLRELNDLFDLRIVEPLIKSTVFEDNNGALEVARTPRIRPRTKHISIKYSHFREKVDNGDVTIEKIDTKAQHGDLFTKPLPLTSFVS